LPPTPSSRQSLPRLGIPKPCTARDRNPALIQRAKDGRQPHLFPRQRGLLVSRGEVERGAGWPPCSVAQETRNEGAGKPRFSPSVLMQGQEWPIILSNFRFGSSASRMTQPRLRVATNAVVPAGNAGIQRPGKVRLRPGSDAAIKPPLLLRASLPSMARRIAAIPAGITARAEDRVGGSDPAPRRSPAGEGSAREAWPGEFRIAESSASPLELP
jgi:hypothetical protein